MCAIIIFLPRLLLFLMDIEPLPAAEQEVHFYATADQISRRKNPHSRTLEELLMEKSASDQYIAEIYSCLNEKIEGYRVGIASRRAEEGPAEVNQYLATKARLYFSFYRGSSHFQQADSAGMFEVDQLYELFVDVASIRDQVKACVYKLHGKNRRRTKVEGYLLIFRIESLMKEILNAAFPSLLYTRTGNTITHHSGTIILSEFQLILLEKQLKQSRKFKIDSLHPLKNSLLELSDEIETLQLQIARQEEALGRVDIRESLLIRNQIDIVEKAIRISKLQGIRLTHEVHAYLDAHIHQAPPLTVDACCQFIEFSPIFRMGLEKIVEYAQQNREEGVSTGSYYNYLKLLIENVEEISKRQASKGRMENCVANLLILLQNQLKWNKKGEHVLILYENYISAVRILKYLDPQSLSKQQPSVASTVGKYLQLIMGHFIDRHWSVIYLITTFQEEFTYSLLTTNHIIPTLIDYEDRFTSLIGQFAPQLQAIIQISKIYLKSAVDRRAFVEEALGRIYYPSLREGCQRLLQGSHLKQKKDVSQSIDSILSIDHESIHQIRPHLQQIKHILMLASIVKRKDLKRNLSKMQQEEYSTLTKIASYFSKERSGCVIYQLKAKILLFITLFRMGYHAPTIKQEQQLVNLRNRIINLYNKLYSHNSASMLLMSRMSSISIRRSNSQESYIIYDPLSPEEGKGGSHLHSVQPEKIQMQASEELLGKINKFITLNFVGKDNNSKSYLTNLLNILEHELFIFEKNIAHQNNNQLSRDYTQHLRVCMGIGPSYQDENIDIILEIERLFYLEEYEKAWQILAKQKGGNTQFNVFLERLESSSSTNNEILKFLRLYNLFEKMSHLVFGQGDKESNLRELTGMANANSLYTIPQRAIQVIYDIKMRENRVAQLEQFYLSRLSSGESVQGDYKEFDSFLSRCTKGEVKVFKQERINKTQLRIEIGKGYSAHFTQLSEQFKKFYLFNHIGIFKFNSITVNTSMQIEIQSNPYIIKPEENLFQSKIIQFQENHTQKFWRKVLQFILQVLNLFYDNTQNYLNAEQIKLQTEPFSFCINPFYSIIQRVLKIKAQRKKMSRFHIGIKNRLMIEKLIQPFLPQFSPCFTSHYFYFLEQLTNIALRRDKASTNKLLQLPLFMTMQQKEVFLVYFDNKMSDMCDSFHEEQRKLRKEKRYNQVQKLRLAKMKDPVYKNYSYHFIMGGVLEAEMCQLQICSQKQEGRLDWISEHKGLMISYDLPKKEGSQEIKQHAYSLNYLLKYLRGALAHKIENNYRIILNISEEFPRIFDYLHRYKVTLEAKYDVVLEGKNSWLREFFLLGQKQKNELSLVLQGKYQGKTLLNADLSQSLAILKGHSERYDDKLSKQLTAIAYKCEKCNEFINIVKKCSKLFDLLLTINTHLGKKNHFLLQEHNFKDCFLSKYYKSHRIMQIFGLLKKVQAKHYIILNWWFYLETELPCLIICLEKIRYALQS